MDPMDGFEVDTVDHDRVEEGFLGTAHLLAQGHVRVALIVHERGATATAEEQRVQGYRRALEQSGLPFDESLVLTHTTAPDLLPLWRQLRRLNPPPTGIVCYNAEMTVQLEGMLHRQRVRVPREMALVSLGDSLASTLVEIPVTAVDGRLRSFAAAVVERLLARIADPGMPPQHVLIKPFLVERESSRMQRRSSQLRINENETTISGQSRQLHPAHVRAALAVRGTPGGNRALLPGDRNPARDALSRQPLHYVESIAGG